MAGNPGKVATLTTQLEEARKELANLKAGNTPKPKPRSFEPEDLHDGTRKRLIRDMLERAADGASLDEIASAWNIDGDTLTRWAEIDVEFGAAVRRSRTHARAAIMAVMRNSLKMGRNLPGSLVDKLLKLYATADDQADDDASALVLVSQGCVDDASTPDARHVIESPSVSHPPTHRPSAAERFARDRGRPPPIAAEGGGG